MKTERIFQKEITMLCRQVSWENKVFISFSINLASCFSLLDSNRWKFISRHAHIFVGLIVGISPKNGLIPSYTIDFLSLNKEEKISHFHLASICWASVVDTFVLYFLLFVLFVFCTTYNHSRMGNRNVYIANFE